MNILCTGEGDRLERWRDGTETGGGEIGRQEGSIGRTETQGMEIEGEGVSEGRL